MKKIINSSKFRWGIFLVVLAFTFVLRAHNYEKIPRADHLDEMLYAWSGINLVEKGVPISWSTLDYPKSAEVYKGRISYQGGSPEAYVTLYQPWLDEPPLFSLIVGWSAHLFKADSSQFIPSSYIRFPVIFIAALTSIMVFLIARSVSGFWTGILSMLLYGTIPIMVFASRSAMPENLIALMFTIILFLLIQFEKRVKFKYLILIPLLIGIAGLSKPTGFFLLFFAIFVVALTLIKKEPGKFLKMALYLFGLTVPFVVIFVLYGQYFDSEIFWRITTLQSYRPAGFNSLAWFFITPAFITTSLLRDSWYVFCLLSAAFFIFKPLEGVKRLVILAFIFWVGVVMISGGENDLLPWYRFPAFPALAIIGAWGVQFLVAKADFFATFIIVGFLLGNRMLLVNAFRPNVDPLQYRIIFSALLLPAVIRFFIGSHFVFKFCQFIMVGVIIVGIYINCVYIYNAYEINCENLSCPLVPTTNLSSIHFPLIWRLFVLGEPTYK